LGTGGSGVGTGDSGLGTGDAGLGTRDSGLGTRDSGLGTRVSGLGTALVSLGCISRIPVGQGRCYVVGAEEIAVFRQRDGRLFATQNRCPHRQGPLSEGVIGGGQVICPLHAHRFELNDGAGAEPGECLKVYGVEVRKGEIFVRLFDGSETC
jgi:nitrite reductase (NADH) small subunit